MLKIAGKKQNEFGNRPLHQLLQAKWKSVMNLRVKTGKHSVDSATLNNMILLQRFWAIVYSAEVKEWNCTV
jgi:hypothetical protein